MELPKNFQITGNTISTPIQNIFYCIKKMKTCTQKTRKPIENLTQRIVKMFLLIFTVFLCIRKLQKQLQQQKNNCAKTPNSVLSV